MTSIPVAPGVPALPAGNVPPPAVPAVSADGVGVTSAASQSGPQWGIFLNGTPLVVPDSIVSVEYTEEYRIASAPQEGGAFESYDKVQMPYRARVVMTKGGTVAQRQDFLNTVKIAVGSLNFYDVVTPEAVFASACFVLLGERRSVDHGATLLTLELGLEQVRVTVLPQAAAPAAGTASIDHDAFMQMNQNALANPASATPTAGGQAQPTAAPANAPPAPDLSINNPQPFQDQTVYQLNGEPPGYGINPAAGATGDFSGVGAYTGGGAYAPGGGAMDPQAGATGAWQ